MSGVVGGGNSHRATLCAVCGIGEAFRLRIDYFNIATFMNFRVVVELNAKKRNAHITTSFYFLFLFCLTISLVRYNKYKWIMWLLHEFRFVFFKKKNDEFWWEKLISCFYAHLKGLQVRNIYELPARISCNSLSIFINAQNAICF